MLAAVGCVPDHAAVADGPAVPRVDEMLPVATHRQWIARILANLLNLFQHTEQMCDYRAMLERPAVSQVLREEGYRPETLGQRAEI